MGITPIGYMFGNGFSARFAERLGIFRMITIGAFIPLIAMSFSGTALILGIVHPLGFFGFTFFIGFGNGWVIPSANAGLLEINPSLAGSAMGLSGAMMTCGGAILATFSGALLSIESGALPLVICIALTTLAGLLSARYTIGIERKQAA